MSKHNFLKAGFVLISIFLVLVVAVPALDLGMFGQDNGSNNMLATRNVAPTLVSYKLSTNPILNNGIESTTFNFSVTDSDGIGQLSEGAAYEWWDTVVVDLRPIGGPEEKIGTYVGKNTGAQVKYYEFTTTVAPTTPQAVIDLNLTLTDNQVPAGETVTTVQITVKQYNRAPVVLGAALKELEVDEDSETYTIADLNTYFSDPDGTELTYDLGSDITNEFNTEFLKALYYDADDSVKINFLPNKFGYISMPIRAHDGVFTTVHNLNITVNSVNDAPKISNMGDGSVKNNSFKLYQDQQFNKYIEASDIDGDDFTFSISFPYEIEPLFEIGEEDGKIQYTPTNDDVGDHVAEITVTDVNEGTSMKTFYFNVTNENDPPYFIRIDDHYVEKSGKNIYFNITEYDWLNITIEAGDPDVELGFQSAVTFQSSLSLLNESFFLEVDEKDPTKGTLSFHAYGPGITNTDIVRGYPPLEGTLTVTDKDDYKLKSTVNLYFNIKNVNDPPSPAKIDYPVNDQNISSMSVEFVAGIVGDPDTPYGDSLTYTWDFNDEDGIDGIDATGEKPTYTYMEPGDYIVTLTVSDSYNASNYVQVLIHIVGDPTGMDSDNDGMSDLWESNNGLDPMDKTGDNGREGDPDGDSVLNWQEMEKGTDPLKKDTDGDGVFDGDDAFPNDASKSKVSKPQENNNWWIFLVIAIVVVVLILALIIIVIVVVLSKKKKEEEEEARMEAEAAAREDQYANQDIYSNVPAVQQQAPPQQPMGAPGGAPAGAPPQGGLGFEPPSESLGFQAPDLGDDTQPAQREIAPPQGPSPAQGPPPAQGPAPPQGPPVQDAPDIQLPPEETAPGVRPPDALAPGEMGTQAMKLDGIIKVLERRVEKLESEGTDVTEAKGLLTQARSEFNEGKYKTAKDLAIEAKGKIA